ncbi:putative DNA ligase-like protein [compost metagenome]
MILSEVSFSMQMKPLIPFEPIRTNTFPSGNNWIAQVKWDGVRMLYYFDGMETRLFNRKMNERTKQYPELLDASAFCKAQSVILDGELIAFDAKKPSFHQIMKRDSLRQIQNIRLSINNVPVTYMIFDILFINGAWVIDKPLEYRQQLIEEIIMPNNNVQIVQNFSDGNTLFELMNQYQMEGVVYKDLSTSYMIKGKDSRWRKHKISNDLYAVVGGVTKNNNLVNSLLLGLFTDEGNLIYIGRAGPGKLTNHDLHLLTEYTNKVLLTKKAFSNEFEKCKDVFWVKPELSVKVEYLEFTPGGTMRHPVVQAMVNFIKEECTITQIPKHHCT